MHKHACTLTHIYENLPQPLLYFCPIVRFRQTKPPLCAQILTTIVGHILTTLIHLSCLAFSFFFPFPSLLFFLTHSHTHTHIVPHQCYILLKRVSEAERPITLTQRVSKKTREKYGGRVKSNRHFSDFNCKCLIAQIIMSNQTRPR